MPLFNRKEVIWTSRGCGASGGGGGQGYWYFLQLHNSESIVTTECTSSMLEVRRLLMELTNFERCSKCLVISVAITMSMIAWRIVRNSSLPTNTKHMAQFGWKIGYYCGFRTQYLRSQHCRRERVRRAGSILKWPMHKVHNQKKKHYQLAHSAS